MATACWPAWFRDTIYELSFTVTASGPLQAVATTAHAALGSLNLVAAVSLTLWPRRQMRDGAG